jgi:hypothetical protein
MTPGHVFVVRGDLRSFHADAWLLPSDEGFETSRSWHGAVPDRRALTAPPGWGHDGVRVARIPEATPPCWMGNVGRQGQPPEWYAEAARQFLEEAAREVVAASTTHRPRPLLALPLVGTGYGGGRAISGELAHVVLRVVAEAVEQCGVDAAIVCWEETAYAALQRARTDLVRRDPRSPAGWPELTEAQRGAAQRLGSQARRGDLVLFLGAGMSVGAGLPTWDALLDDLAQQAGMDDGQREALERLPVLDRGRIVERRLAEAGRRLDEEVRRLLHRERYPLSLALVAPLPANEVVTMNYDRLFEAASRGAGRELAVLPWEPARSGRRWLLKMHGCVERGDIVLTRHDYHRYEQKHAALAGIVQALLITRHMLFLGFGLQDQNFHRIVEDVRQVVRRDGRPAAPFGTAVVLADDELVEELWRNDLAFVSMGGPTAGASGAGRRVELLLDCLGAAATDQSAHLLDDRYQGMLTGAERVLAQRLRALRTQLPDDVAEVDAWRRVEQLLRELGQH